jgi:hypothetical protein
MKLSICNHPVSFDVNSTFSREFQGPSGITLIAKTMAGDPILYISPGGRQPKRQRVSSGALPRSAPLTQEIIRIPLHGCNWHMDVEPLSTAALISLPGKKPKPGSEPTSTAKIKLGAEYGSWRVEPNLEGSELHITFIEGDTADVE